MGEEEVKPAIRVLVVLVIVLALEALILCLPRDRGNPNDWPVSRSYYKNGKVPAGFKVMP